MTRRGSRKTRPSKAKPAMRITKARREQIERLAAALAEIAPSTSPGTGFCVRKVADDMGLKDCWKKQRNKKADIAHLLENVIRRYPRKPKALVLAIVRGGVEWKARKGERVTKEHLDAIAEPMEVLGFRIREDLQAIEIPEPSRVRHPSQDMVALLDRLDLHEALADDVAEMFRDGHFNEAVRKALERFEKFVQDTLGDHKTFGRDLMAKAFGGEPPPIALNALTTANDRSEQEGFKFLTMGAMSGMRNLYSHGDVEQMSAMDAIERLCFVSLLFKRVTRALAEERRGTG
ncbi:MAG: hypothetical protein KatS3mg076_2436 [Candidatus Binatia bacterium]|nr:MAG: hypothetical protein KatS3mg076_2436 [Candidatus Binatia bacterium]GIW56911.1 MAG: hypothetical protein KatS3mg082_3315 [Nitrospiraceae bacterium]